MRSKISTFLWIGGGLCIAGAVLCIIVLALGGFDFMKLTTTEKFEDRTQVVSVEGLETIRLDVKNQRVEIRSTSDASITVHYRAFEQDTYTFDTQDGVFTMTHRDGSSWRQNLVLGIFSGIARAGQKVVVEIPTAYAGGLEARTTNASLLAENLSGLKACTFETTNGSLHLDKITTAGDVTARTTNASAHIRGIWAASARLSSTNGSVRVEYCTLEQALTVETSNASIQLSRASSATAEIGTTNSGISFENCAFGEKVAAHTTNSSVRVNWLSAPDIHLQSTNGSINGSIVGEQSDFSIVTTTTNASASPASVIRKEAPASLTAVTTNGRIALEFVSP